MHTSASRTIGLAALALSAVCALWACKTEETESQRPVSSSECATDDPTCKETSDEVEVGRLAVETRECTKCHDSPKGKMAGTSTNISKEEGVELYAPNLTKDYETGIGSWTDDQVVIAIRTGLDNDGMSLCPQMQHFTKIEDAEAYAIVKYLRSLPVVSNKVPRSVCPPLKTKEEQN